MSGFQGKSTFIGKRRSGNTEVLAWTEENPSLSPNLDICSIIITQKRELLFWSNMFFVYICMLIYLCYWYKMLLLAMKWTIIFPQRKCKKKLILVVNLGNIYCYGMYASLKNSVILCHKKFKVSKHNFFPFYGIFLYLTLFCPLRYSSVLRF